METSVLIAKMIAVIYLLVALGGFFNENYFRRIYEDMHKNAELTYISGLLALIFGLLIVHFHNRWESNWTILVTIVGWLAIVKGALIIVFPQFSQRFYGPLFTDRSQKILSSIVLLMGLLFGYFGFVH